MSAEPLRRTGRPDQQASEELVRHIVDTATRLFIDQGYAATSIEQIAAAAGSGKQTIYRRFTSKEGLFTEVINRQGKHLLDAAATAAAATGAKPIDALKENCRMVFDFMLQPDMIRLFRVLVAEVGRFPGLGDYVLDNCMGPFKAHERSLLQAAMEAGQIRKADIDLVQAIMVSLMTGWATQQGLLGREPFKTLDERHLYFEAAWTLFLRGAGDGSPG